MPDNAPEPTLKVKSAEAAPAPAVAQSEALDPVLQAARKTAEVTDARGRVLKIRKLNAMHKLDLSQLLGAEAVHNQGVVGPCSMAWSVTHIDGEEIFPPRTYEELRALVGRLDDEGISAVEDAIVANFGVQRADTPEARASEAAEVKNS